MANEKLKQLFQDMHSDIAVSVNPDTVMDVLFSKKVIGSDDYYKLRQVSLTRDRCRDMLSLLHQSLHPQSFIHLRLALLDDYPWLVDEIDKKLPLLTSQVQQLQSDHSINEDKCNILPRSSNTLHAALANARIEEASRFISSQREACLVECSEGMDGCLKSCLHTIAAFPDTAQATTLGKQLLQKVHNAQNREYLLNMRTIGEFRMGDQVRARVAAIHIAAYHGNAGVVRLLCQEYGVDVNCSSQTIEEEWRKGITPLEWAARKGHTEVVQVLINSKADVNASRPTDGVTPVYIAAQNGHAKVVKLLLDNKADVNASRNTGATPLYVAAQDGHKKIVKLLLDKKADVNASRKKDGSTPLHVASEHGHTEVVKLLLDSKANVNAVRKDGVTPVYIAAEGGKTQVAKLLLDNKADGNTTRYTGATPLFAAAQNGHLEVVKLLLDNGVDVDACRLTDDATPLYAAAKNGHSEVVKLLLENNADVNARRRGLLGDKPIDVARLYEHFDIVDLIHFFTSGQEGAAVLGRTSWGRPDR